MNRLLFISLGLILGGCAAGLRAAPASVEGSNPPPATSPEEALRNYRKGRFEQSEDQYSALAREHPDDARLRFNAGAAAYRRNDLTNAARWFESVVSAPDLKLQQQAYYNLGNTRYRLGEGVADPQGRQRLWQEALTNFTAASKLDAADAQAAGNLAFVRQKLKELQEQTPPPPQQQDQQQKSDGKDRNPQQDSSKSQDSDQGQSPQEDNPSPQSEDSSGQQPSRGKSSGDPQDRDANPKEDPGDSRGEDAGKDGSGKPEENQPASDGGAQSKGRQGEGEDASENGAGGEAVSAADQVPGEMTRAQALQVLEGQKGDEKALLLRSYGGNKQSERASRIRKPW